MVEQKDLQAKGASLVSLGSSLLLFGLTLRHQAFLAGVLIGTSILFNILGSVYFARMSTVQKKG